MLKTIRLGRDGIRLYESKHQSGDRVQPHYHAVYQLLYALEGKGSVHINQVNYRFEKDALTCIPPQTRHAVFSEEKLTVLVLAFDIQPQDSTSMTHLLNQYFQETKWLQLNPFDSRTIRQLLRTMLYEQKQRSEFKQVAMHIYLSELLLQIARVEEQPQMIDANRLRAERLKQYIDTHYFEWTHAEDLAARLGISTRRMNTIFKESFHQTPMQYLNEVRINLAKKMLVETDMDIASICFEVGFESISTFYRAFKNVVHLSPHKYRTNERSQ
ncbi:hypothetical protein J416_03351 [Gracilibacillus halophilus YIM-C55.5]|uniref:HTH araC/xylS-type domain-containing protein n=1 Tax=Gracilibacillus halophilus YIM-C55.5 TaxID=1308866 RepID=N4WF16_9BACI|nr:helix-turn-helix domain-containing protein [Gracilibacillus halophilus]ENH97864.1 hypothetical protein J416_03351 [Gracilibacillus halophilus YIM-C55.5]